MKNRFLLLAYILLQGMMAASAQNNEFSYPVLPNVSSASTDPIGSSAGKFDVSPLGAATYDIPIEAPMGLPGMQPKISLTYNSQASNSIVGYGFNISGLSVITRGVRNIYHDGAAHGINYTDDDAFYLDGQRLISINDNEDSDSTIFCPENNPYVKVVRHKMTTSPSSSIWFSVVKQDGIYYEYGTSEASTFSVGSKSLAWYICRAENSIGNEISFDYTKDGHAIYPSVIVYGREGDNVILVNKIVFSYEDRPDSICTKSLGNSIVIGRRLKQVATYTEYTVFRKYILLYDDTSDNISVPFSRLKKVIVSNSIGETLRPIQLEWSFLSAFVPSVKTFDIDITKSENKYTTSIKSGTSQIFCSDLNADGIADIIHRATVSYKSGNGLVSDLTAIYTYKSGRDPSSGNIVYSGPYCSFLHPDIAKWNHWNDSPIIADRDGDGFNDLIIPYVKSGVNHSVEFYFVSGKLGSYGLDTPCIFSHEIETGSSALYTCADFNLDGKADVLLMEVQPLGQNKHRCRISWGRDSQELSTDSIFTLEVDGVPKKIFADDFDANGMPDIMVVTNGGYQIYWNEEGVPNSSLTVNDSLIGGAYRLYPGDFNGDGATDFLVTLTGQMTWWISYGNGDGTFTRKAACSLMAHKQIGVKDNKDESYQVCQVADFDGDGKSDVLVTSASFTLSGKFNKTYTYWLKSDGVKLEVAKYLQSSDEDNANIGYFLCGDFNGDGLAEVANFGFDCFNGGSRDNILRAYLNSTFSPNIAKVRSVTDGFGNKTAIEYLTLTSPSIYTKGTDSNNAVIDCAPPLHVVSKVQTNIDTNSQQTTTYKYGGLKLHTHGKGVLGFSQVQASNSATQTVVTDSITWDYGCLVPLKISAFQTIGEQTASNITAISLYQPFANKKIFFQFPSETTENDFDGNQSVTTTQYNLDKGVITQVSQTHADGTATMEYRNHVLCGSKWLPSDIVKRTQYVGKATFADAMHVIYDDNNGLRVNVTEHYGTTNAVMTTYTYDDFGNVTSAITTASGVESVTKTYTYDISRRYITKSTERGLIEKYYTYDMWGNVLTETDKTRPGYPLTTTYTYDGWGNLLSETLPTGERTTYQYGWGTSKQKNHYVLRQATANPWELTWFDCLGQKTEVQTVMSGGTDFLAPKGIIKTTNYLYNPRGQITGKYVSWGNQYKTFYHVYDARGRIIEDHRDIDDSTSYEYEGNCVKRTENGREYTEERDLWGNVVRLTDPQCSVTYEYGSNGKLVAVSTGESTVTMEYDQTGNQTALHDADAGTMTYVYDAYGRLVSQTDARGNVTKNTYDVYGRLLTSITDDVSTINVYGTTASNRGLLVGQSRSGNTISYQYDEYGRVLRERRNVSGLGTRDIKFTYNDQGLVGSTLYPSGLSVQYVYDAYGTRTGTYADGQLIYNLEAVSDTSQLISQGERVKMSIVHNDKWETTRRRMIGSMPYDSGFPGVNYLFDHLLYDMTFAYHPTTGNLLSRTGMYPEQEQFGYDDLDRLVSISRDALPQHEIAYAANGNITYQTGIGHYYYDSTRPHAVAGVENTANLIPHTEQLTTFNSFGKIASIEDKGNGCRMTFDYGPDNERWRTRLYQGDILLRTIYYMGDYEEIVTDASTRRLYYLDGDALYIRDSQQGDSLYFFFTDHLGSIIAIVNAAGDEVFHATYDAWGNQRVLRNDIDFHRGYTGHEMLPQFGLINMNGRLYDPLVGRFLSTDNFVQEPGNSQNFNRYSYCLNNPLKYTDPDGEWIHILIGALVGGAGNVIIKLYNGQIDNWQDALVAFGIGAATGAVASATGGAVLSIAEGGGLLVNVVSGAVGATFSMPIQGMGNSMYFGDPMLSDGEYLSGILFAGALSGISYSISAVADGRNIWTGEKRMWYPVLEEVEPAPIANSNQSNSLNTPQNVSLSENWPDQIAEQTRATPKFPLGNGNNSAYVGVDANNEIRYVGISNNPERRFAEHLRSNTLRNQLDYRVLENTTNLSRIQARIIEQQLINEYGLGKNGGFLINQINSMAPKYWDRYGISIGVKIKF